MTKARKARIDSATQAVKVMAAATKELLPPAHAPLDDDALPFWNDIMKARAKSEWTAHDLAYASDLANAMAQQVKNRAKLRSEGEVIFPEDGKPYANPRVAVVHGLHAQIKSARQSLSIHGRAAGEARDVGKRRAHAKAVEGDNPLEADDDLLARPALN